MNDMSSWNPKPRNLLAEAVAALNAVPSFDLGFGPRLYEVPGTSMHDLTEMQVIDVAVRQGLIVP